MEILAAVYGFFGWKWLVVLAWSYVCMLIGANSPTTFKRSKAGLQRIAEDALAKARLLAMRGK